MRLLLALVMWLDARESRFAGPVARLYFWLLMKGL
jgi:hypothetical protein